MCGGMWSGSWDDPVYLLYHPYLNLPPSRGKGLLSVIPPSCSITKGSILSPFDRGELEWGRRSFVQPWPSNKLNHTIQPTIEQKLAMTLVGLETAFIGLSSPEERRRHDRCQEHHPTATTNWLFASKYRPPGRSHDSHSLLIHTPTICGQPLARE